MKTTTPTLLLILLVLGLLGQGRGGKETESCPASPFGNESSDQSSNNEYYTSKYSKGDMGKTLVENLRTKSEQFYQDVINNAVMYACDVELASKRCVDQNSGAKDWAGECINAADQECPLGLCERSSNCYWNSAKEGQNRTTRFDAESYAQAEENLIGFEDSYARDIATVGVAGIAVSVVLMLLWALFFVVRYLCCCLWIPCHSLCWICSPLPRKQGYSAFTNLVVPGCLYLGALIAVAISGSMALVGNEDISVSISNTFLHSYGLVDDLQRFLGRSSVPLNNIQGIIIDAASDAKDIFEDTEFVTEDAHRIVDSFVGFYTLHSDGLNASDALSQFDDASSQFEEKVGPITDSVQEMLHTLEWDLYDQADLLDSAISGALDQLQSFNQQTTDWETVIFEYEAAELGTREIRRAGVFILFAVPFVFSLMGFAGIVFANKRTCSSASFNSIRIAGFVSAVCGSLALVAASVFLCASFVINDACQMSSLVIRDFEPFVGDRVSPGANAAFNDTNLAVAFNVSDKVDFQQKLEKGLEEISSVNVTAQFDRVLLPLEEIQDMIGTITETAMVALNEATNVNTALCPFGGPPFSKGGILSPWDLARAENFTSYPIRDNLGQPTTYGRLNLEDGETYMARIHDKTGVCSDPSDCCIFGLTAAVICESDLYENCDSGQNCIYPCEAIQVAIVEGYKATVSLLEQELRMTKDLGVVCPVDSTCPTPQFQALYSNSTLVDMIQNYKHDIIKTKDLLVSLAETSVGDAMLEVEDFLCNMNITFIEGRFIQVKTDICETLFGGVSQITWSLWIFGLALETIAVMSHILVVRVRSKAEREGSFNHLDGDRIFR